MITEKTGYPKDMLELDLDMEADLGIDTVKQAELFAAIREHYSIPRRDNVALKDYPTIRHCIRFVMDEKAQSASGKSQVTEQQSQVTSHNPLEVPSQMASGPQTARSQVRNCNPNLKPGIL